MTSPSYARMASIARTPGGRESHVGVFESELGWMAAYWLDGILARLTFGHPSPQAAAAKLVVSHDPVEPTPAMYALVERLQAFACGACHDDFLDVPLLVMGMTPFQQSVVERCRRIPGGETLSYGALAAEVGHAGAARAVGRVMATNRFPLIVPCHRVVAAGGAIGGFSAPHGIDMKRRLLDREQDENRGRVAASDNQLRSRQRYESSRREG